MGGKSNIAKRFAMNRSEKNILLVSLENLDHGIQHNYYCSNDEGDPKFCDGIMRAEAATKYILSASMTMTRNSLKDYGPFLSE